MNPGRPEVRRGHPSEVAPGVHHFPTEPFNWYVIDEGGRLTVVDAGFPGHWGTLVAGLASLGRTPRDVDAVLLTHAHADHVGFAERLRRESGARVWVHRDDRERAGRVEQVPPLGFRLNLWRPFVVGLMAGAVRAGAFRVPGIREATPFGDGDVLPVPGAPRVIHTPGHTPGECVFLLEDRGVLLSGDTLVTLDLMTGRSVAPRVPARLLNDDPKRAARSLDRLAGLGRWTMLPGHGPAWAGDLGDAVRAARGSGPGRG